MIPDKIELFRIPVRLPEGWRTGLGPAPSTRPGLLVAVSQDGLTGWGECVAGEAPLFSHETNDGAWSMIERHLAPGLCGRLLSHPSQVAELPHFLRIRGHRMAKAALEAALWDLYGQQRSEPLHTLIGGTHQRVPVGVSLSIGRDLGGFLDTIAQRLQDGYRRIKCKIAPGWDVQPLQAARLRFPKALLTVDANGVYGRGDFEVFKALDELDLQMIEQPLPPDDLVGHAQLQARLRTPICLDESIETFAEAETAAALGACRIVNLKVGRLGGLSEVLKLQAAGDRLGFRFFVGGMFETSIGRHANLHIASRAEVTLAGDIPARPTGQPSDASDLAGPRVELCPETGTVAVPSAPGIGMTVRLDRVQQNAVRYRCIHGTSSPKHYDLAQHLPITGGPSGNAAGAGDPRPDPQQPLPRRSFGAIHEAFFQQASAQPHRDAIRQGSTSISYEHLCRLSLRTARELHQRGLQGRRVALLAGRSFALIWGMLAISRAGAVCVVLPKDLTFDAASSRCRAAEVSLLLHADDLKPFADDLASALALPCCSLGNLRDLDDAPQQDIRDASHLPTVPSDADAYVVFTSGTTGQPKGVLNTHAPLVHFLAWQQRRFGLTSRDRFSMLSGLSHDIMLRDIFAPLSLGATLVLPPHEDIRARGLSRWLQDETITVTHLTPARGALIVADGEALPQLRKVFFGGDKLSMHLAEAFQELVPQATLVNFYGTTETPQAASFHELDGTPLQAEIAPIGRGIKDVQLLVLDPERQLAKVGDTGVLAVRTPFLSRGYLGDPASTQRTFIVNPFTRDRHDLIYLTGDLGRYGDDGVVHILGRADRQLKIRGVRIEPASIEARLTAIEGIHQALVTADGNGEGRRLAAFLVRGPERDDETEEELRSRIRRDLLANGDVAEMPAALSFIDSIPLTANGKIDHSALPAMGENSASGTNSRNALEAFLVERWRESLGVAKARVDDDFFSLGGHSLTAVQVLAAIRTEYSVELPLQAIFLHPTPASLACCLEDALLSGRTPHLGGRPPVTPTDDVQDGESFPLSYGQASLLRWEAGNIGQRPARIWLTLRLEGALHTDRLASAWDALVRRHATLRLHLVEGSNGAFLQRVTPWNGTGDGGTRLERLPLPRLEHGTPEDALWAALQGWNQGSFPVGEPLVKARLLSCNPQLHFLSVMFHHAVLDGHGRRLLLRQWSDLYRTKEVQPRRQRTVEYADFVRWQQQLPQPSSQRRAVWQSRMADLPGPPIPYDRQPDACPSIGSHSERACLGASTTAALEALARELGVTLFAVLLAQLARLLQEESGQSDLVIAVPFTDRGSPEMADVVGYCVNVLLLRIDLNGAKTFREVVRRVWNTFQEATTYGHEPLDWWLERLGLSGDARPRSLFSVYFNLLYLEEELLRLDGVEVSRLEHPDIGHNRFAVTDVNLLVRPVYPSDARHRPTWQESGLSVEWRLRQDRYHASTAQRLNQRFQDLCRDPPHPDAGNGIDPTSNCP